MGRLILLRHAKSAWPEGVADLDRPLNERGRATASRMGAYLRAEKLVPDHVFVSPARRTQETWEMVRRDLPGVEAETVPMIYEASASRILDAVHSAPDRAETLLVIGHNPGLQDFAMLLIGEGSPSLRANLREKFPTAGLAVIDVPADHWSGIGRAGGRLERFVVPRDLTD
ncbi:SixA phosphatase family protein [Methylobacterium brachythecii]|uniref:Phosphoglycerate mutase n=1 Tax=Methylobacterium brachythecii TaxID=1176177 RepID=A0A7W6F8X7_9HYPH|nr:histidine phosphatase family protein [Methylobacterium brachythecii]MBB3904909.1 phosphohistidine phosphatase [Methylobacterium brachythecii]GLS46901.1 phosphoglycerate mutase [Methylobacterium brachythecii]